MRLIFAYLFGIFIGVASKKAHHAIPTYFHRRYSNSSLIDRQNEREFQSVCTKDYKPRLSEDVSIRVVPSKSLANKEEVTVSWQINSPPSKQDWIGLFCPKTGQPNEVLDYFHITVSSTWKEGYGKFKVFLYNLRTECEFRYYHFDDSALLAVSETITFKHGANEPLQGHVSMTRNPGEMRVMWVSGTEDTPVVYYGLFEHAMILKSHGTTRTYNASQMCAFPASSVGFRDPGYIHDVLLQPLLTNTRYYYQFGDGQTMSDVYNFTTPLPAGNPTPHMVITYGDQGVVDSPGSHGTAARIIEEYRDNNIRKVLHNGDISYAMGYAYIWEQWFSLVQPYATLVPYMITIGNHEQDHWTGGEKDPSGAGNGFHPIWGNFGADSGGECGVPMYYRFHMADNGHSIWWYSYDFGLVHYVVMSTEHDYSPGTAQHAWLENDLKAVNRKVTPWVVITGHRPMYTSQEQLDEEEVAINMQKLFEDLLHTYQVDLALWSHVHSYQRTCKLYRNKCTADGTVHIVVGTAGRPIDLEFFEDKPWLRFSSEEFGYGRLWIANATSMKYEFVTNKDRKVIDSYWFEK